MEDPKTAESVAVAGPTSGDDLYQLVWAKPMLKVAEQFGVSSSYMARICAVMNVPRPERGHWAKLAVGQRLSQPLLPEALPEDQLVWGRGIDLSVVPRAKPRYTHSRRRDPSSRPRQPEAYILSLRAQNPTSKLVSRTVACRT